ncbi:protein of unknown function [Nitratireductor aquimarinus]
MCNATWPFCGCCMARVWRGSNRFIKSTVGAGDAAGMRKGAEAIKKALNLANFALID